MSNNSNRYKITVEIEIVPDESKPTVSFSAHSAAKARKKIHLQRNIVQDTNSPWNVEKI